MCRSCAWNAIASITYHRPRKLSAVEVEEIRAEKQHERILEAQDEARAEAMAERNERNDDE
jgi:hypothetical protein